MRAAVRCPGWSVWLCLALVLCARAPAQILDATNAGTPPADLSAATWRFTVGDNPRWADPAFDDSQWKPITPTKNFKDQGYPVPRGFFWLRLHVRMKPGAKSQAIAVDDTSYQVFANGRLIGQQGGMPDHPGYYGAVEQVFSIPADVVQAEAAVIAIREWYGPLSEMGGTLVQLGDERALQIERRAELGDALLHIAPKNLRTVVALMVGLWALALYRAQPEHREYLWLGTMGLLNLAISTLETVCAVSQVSLWWWLYAPDLLTSLHFISFVLFICHFLRLRVSWPIRIYCASFPLMVLLEIARTQGWIAASFDVDDVVYVVNGVALALFAPWLAIRQYRRGDREAGMLLISLFFLSGMRFAEVLGILLNMVHLRAAPASLIPDLQLGPVHVDAKSSAWLLFWLSIGAVMLRRSLAITRLQQRTAAELEAARSVQAFLLGREVSSPGYKVESAYLPAQEVGGDFFQTIAGPDGSLLAVIGDVAGKGLQAAMRVSMLIGAVRLSPNESPAAVLGKLNSVLLQDGNTGFTTCLAARLDADCTVTIANAGHLSPYLNGRELAIHGGLPLGIAGDVEYCEQTFAFAAGDVMLLMSDGVVEARNPIGELFGFERMARTAAAVTSANALAATASAFGQDDDITVLLLQRATT